MLLNYMSNTGSLYMASVQVQIEHFCLSFANCMQLAHLQVINDETLNECGNTEVIIKIINNSSYMAVVPDGINNSSVAIQCHGENTVG